MCVYVCVCERTREYEEEAGRSAASVTQCGGHYLTVEESQREQGKRRMVFLSLKEISTFYFKTVSGLIANSEGVRM